MLYTFEFTNSQLMRVDDWLSQQGGNQYIIAVQRRLFEDSVITIIDCDPATAVWLALMGGQDPEPLP